MKNLLAKLTWAHGVNTNLLQNIFRLFAGAFLLYAGISHLTFHRLDFVAQVPNWVPLPTDLVVVLSGIVEILIGLSLILLKRWQALVGIVTAVFFILVFPGNLAQYHNQIDAFGLDTDEARFIRLFFQPVLILWSLWSTGAFKAFRNCRIGADANSHDSK